MFHKKMMRKQLEACGVRLGDSCTIFPWQGRKKDFTLNRTCIDIVSTHHRPDNLAFSWIELPKTEASHFHYRLELEDSRYILKTLKGSAFGLNGLAAKEAFIERHDRLFIDDNKINFNPFDLKEIVERQFDHPVLMDQQLVSSDLKILIQGETGTGKTHLASRIHEKSGRAGKFVAVNLSSFNSNLIESELFGHKKGAFTGATADKRGAFLEAEYGTLFLDEIDSLSLELQTKLLTFLDSNKFRPVGDQSEVKMKTRLIFASGRPMETLIQQNKFRRDFYFRLKAGHTIELPSLRNETSKIREACQFYSLTHEISLSTRLLDFYETLAWPGNLRQLFGHLEKKKVLSRGQKIDFDHLDEELLTMSSDLMSLDEKTSLLPMEEMKTDYARRALALCDGNVAMAARKLRVTEKTVKNLVTRSSSQERM